RNRWRDRSASEEVAENRCDITECLSLAAAAPTTTRLTVYAPRPRSSAAAGYAASASRQPWTSGRVDRLQRECVLDVQPSPFEHNAHVVAGLRACVLFAKRINAEVYFVVGSLVTSNATTVRHARLKSFKDG